MSQAPAAPEGFTRFDEMGGYIGLSGPYWWRRDGDEFVYGFASDERHGNPNGVLHGAAILTFLDTCLGRAVVMSTGRICATIALNAQFVSPAPAGSWITGRVQIRKTTRTMVFLDAEARSGENLLVTATAIFRLFDAA